MGISTFSEEEMIFKPLTRQYWQHFTQLFEEHGPENGC